MYRTLLVVMILTLALVTAFPVATAGDGPVGDPQCVQVYPWSQVCQGDVGAVLCYYVAGLPEETCGPILR